MITVWKKEKDSSGVLSSLALEEGTYEFIFLKNLLTKITIMELMKVDAKRGSIYDIGKKEIKPVHVKERENDFSIFVEVVHNENALQEAGFVSVSIALGLLGIISIAFLLEVRKTFTTKTLVGVGFIAAIVIGFILFLGRKFG